ncbi:MAG: hypothetical protein WCG28_00260 [bacterium]
MKHFELNIWSFLIYFILYSLISFFVFLSVFGGWIGLIIFPILLLFFLILIISIIGVTIRRYRLNKFLVEISYKYLFFMIGIHLVTVLFGGGDCGDSPGIHTIFRQLFFPKTVCISSSYISVDNQASLSFFLLLAYCVSLIIFLIHVFLKNSTYDNESETFKIVKDIKEEFFS